MAANGAQEIALERDQGEALSRESAAFTVRRAGGGLRSRQGLSVGRL